MFLSSIPVDTGNDPTRLWPGKKWLSNPYRVHQRLCMAFDGPRPQVHEFVAQHFAPPPPPLHVAQRERPPREKFGGFLFRIEGPVITSVGLRPRILVQSSTPPDWDAAFGNAPFFVVARDIKTKPYNPSFTAGQRLRFRLHANPAVKKKREGKKQGARLGIMSEDGKLQWFHRKAAAAGFTPLQVSIIPGGLQHSRRSKQIDPNRHVHLAATFEGILEVADPVVFRSALEAGIGPAKAYGFGLLSIAPA